MVPWLWFTVILLELLFPSYNLRWSGTLVRFVKSLCCAFAGSFRVGVPRAQVYWNATGRPLKTRYDPNTKYPKPPLTFSSFQFLQWAGKTIALGTFPSAEADEKCARAKALTRAWRSTMRPKPTRDWVMLELERLGVRVVSGRLGRKAGDDDEGDKKGGGRFYFSFLAY